MPDTKQGSAAAAPAAATPETLAAILADYRADIPAMTSGELPHPTPEYLRILLDRIEAAAERERNAHTNDIHDALYMATGIPGNAAAMREALEYAERWLHGMLQFCDRRTRGEEIRVPALSAFGTVDRISAALATSARNRERFNSWEDAYIAWVKETQDCADHPIDWGELPGDAYEAAEELWMHYFADDQNREFCDWLWELEETK